MYAAVTQSSCIVKRCGCPKPTFRILYFYVSLLFLNAVMFILVLFVIVKYEFLPRDATQSAVIVVAGVRPSVRLSVCHSHSCIVSKQLKRSYIFLIRYRLIVLVFEPIRYKIPDGTPERRR